MTTERPGHPHARSAVARFLDKRLDELRGVKTQREIAKEADFARPNFLSMLKTGDAQLPLDRVPALAKALDVDPAHLFRLALQDHWPSLRSNIGDIFGRQMASENEAAIFLGPWRAATHDADPAPNDRIQTAVDAMIKAALAMPS